MRSTHSARLGALAIATLLGSACSHATSGSSPSLALDPRRAAADSVVAQRVADVEGPGGRIRAVFDASNGARRVDALFSLDHDAYVVVGHLGVDGHMSIVFPVRPGDDGFVRAGHTYRTPTIFAGFSDELAQNWYLYRPRAFRSTSARNASYDGGLGYVFLIASWRPLRLDRISSGNRWESYDVEDIQYLHDPREAVEELGAVLAGDNREAYTVEYASYYGTTGIGASGYAYNSFGRCSLFSAFDYPSFSPFALSYSFLGGGYGACSPFAGGFGLFASRPTLSAPTNALPAPAATRRFVRGIPGRDSLGTVAVAPLIGSGSGAARIGISEITAPAHRPGLFTVDEGAAVESRPAAAHRPGFSPTVRTERPSIQDMVGRATIAESRRAASGALGARHPGSSVGAAERADAAAHSYNGGVRVAPESERTTGWAQSPSERRGTFSPGATATERGRAHPSGDDAARASERPSPSSTRSEPAARPSPPAHASERPSTAQAPAAERRPH